MLKYQMGGKVVHSISTRGNSEHSCCAVITGNEVMAIIIRPYILTIILKFIIGPNNSTLPPVKMHTVKSYFKYKYTTHPSPSFNVTSLNIRVDLYGMVELEVNTEWKAMVSERKWNFINWVTIFNSSESHHNITWQCSETTILVMITYFYQFSGLQFCTHQ